jgi:hypothetical protein
LLGVSYRQGKRLWKRYREEGAAGLKHRSAGQRSKRAYPDPLRGEVLRGVRDKYGGAVGERLVRRWRPSTWPRRTGCVGQAAICV